jgi:hypothetical protein
MMTRLNRAPQHDRLECGCVLEWTWHSWLACPFPGCNHVPEIHDALEGCTGTDIHSGIDFRTVPREEWPVCPCDKTVADFVERFGRQGRTIATCPFYRNFPRDDDPNARRCTLGREFLDFMDEHA